MVPEIAMHLDISAWCASCGRVFDEKNRDDAFWKPLLALVSGRCKMIATQVSNGLDAQLFHVGDENNADVYNTYKLWWSSVWTAMVANGHHTLYSLADRVPLPSNHAVPFIKSGYGDESDVNTFVKNNLRSLFGASFPGATRWHPKPAKKRKLEPRAEPEVDPAIAAARAAAATAAAEAAKAKAKANAEYPPTDIEGIVTPLPEVGEIRYEWAHYRRVYSSLDNETPKQIATKFNVKLKQVLLDNKRLHPGLSTHAKLYKRTSIVLPWSDEGAPPRPELERRGMEVSVGGGGAGGAAATAGAAGGGGGGGAANSAAFAALAAATNAAAATDAANAAIAAIASIAAVAPLAGVASAAGANANAAAAALVAAAALAAAASPAAAAKSPAAPTVVEGGFVEEVLANGELPISPLAAAVAAAAAARAGAGGAPPPPGPPGAPPPPPPPPPPGGGAGAPPPPPPPPGTKPKFGAEVERGPSGRPKVRGPYKKRTDEEKAARAIERKKMKALKAALADGSVVPPGPPPGPPGPPRKAPPGGAPYTGPPRPVGRPPKQKQPLPPARPVPAAPAPAAPAPAAPAPVRTAAVPKAPAPVRAAVPKAPAPAPKAPAPAPKAPAPAPKAPAPAAPVHAKPAQPRLKLKIGLGSPPGIRLKIGSPPGLKIKIGSAGQQQGLRLKIRSPTVVSAAAAAAAAAKKSAHQ